MGLRYRCLVADHDDTSVMSTASIHYPAHVEAMRRLRPDERPCSLEGFLMKNFDPGLVPFLTEELGLSRAELEASYAVWRKFTASRVPEFFPGMLDLFAEFKRRGGRLVVVSHSEVRMIERDYRVSLGGGAGSEGAANALPDLVYGWDDDPERRKPHPFPLLDAMARLGLERGEILVIDDLKPGADMAAAAGVDFAAAGWGHSIPEIRSAMRGLCSYYLETVEDLRRLVLG